MIKVLFVCLGNICRSPMAEGVFKHLVKQNGLETCFFADSAGTSAYHIGEAPDNRMCATAAGYSIILDHKARQFVKEDFHRFDYILAMDRSNYTDILKLVSGADVSGKVRLMREFDPFPGNLNVPDPYYGGMDGFENVYNILERSNGNFLKFLIEKHRLNAGH